METHGHRKGQGHRVYTAFLVVAIVVIVLLVLLLDGPTWIIAIAAMMGMHFLMHGFGGHGGGSGHGGH